MEDRRVGGQEDRHADAVAGGFRVDVIDGVEAVGSAFEEGSGTVVRQGDERGVVGGEKGGEAGLVGVLAEAGRSSRLLLLLFRLARRRLETYLQDDPSQRQ